MMPRRSSPDQRFVPRIKSTAVRVIAASGVANLFRPLTRGTAVVFMLHRFADPDRDVGGYDPASVARMLAYLRRNKYELVGLESLVKRLGGEGPPLRHTVAFTIDDGYVEHATIACPLFAGFDCPVTTFVPTGFLDGALWFWWDQIEYVFTHTARPSLAFDIERGHVCYVLGDTAARRSAQENFTTRCKALPDHRKHEAIRHLADIAEVSLPEQAPARYAPMSWDQLRACERNGMTFGAHTVTHPILARTGDGPARAEIVASWARLQAEAARSVPVFAYPNGQPGDFSDREFRVLGEIGLTAVTGVAGFATPRRYRSPNGPFLVPRFALPDSLPYLVQQVGGLERLKFLLRGTG